MKKNKRNWIQRGQPPPLPRTTQKKEAGYDPPACKATCHAAVTPSLRANPRSPYLGCLWSSSNQLAPGTPKKVSRELSGTGGV